MSAGNAVTGESWQETKVFYENSTLKEIMAWAWPQKGYSEKRITITKPHNDE
jgi:hypothetical protein